MGLCVQNRHIVNAKLCAQGFTHIPAHSERWQGLLTPYMCPNPIWKHSPICRPFGCSRVYIRKETNLVQQVCGTFLYYTIAIDNTILPALSSISSEKSKATKNTSKQVAKFLNYLASNTHTEIQYRASEMQLAINSDASYLSVSQDTIRSSGVHFISKGPPNPTNTEDFVPSVNGILLVVCKIVRNIMASAAEAEYGTIFVD